ncbi:MAG: cation:proton antiporter [Patescibacteria group bacterium]
MTTELFQLAITILLAAGLGFLARFLRQPLILAYIAAGTVAAYFGFFHIRETFTAFSDLGIMFLLFLVGLEINYTSLRRVGKAAAVVGLLQIIITFGAGFYLAQLFNFDVLPAAYIAIALTFSSTIVVVKLLSEKRDMSSLYGKMALGILLIQDFVAIMFLVFLAGIGTGGDFRWLDLVGVVMKGVVLFGLMLWLGRKILPFIFDRIARSQELLFLTSLAWVFLVAALVSKIGFSIEIAGFLAGVALANSSEHFQIASRFRPLRDFFILVFFALLGSSIVLSNFSGLGWPILGLSLFVLIGNPLIVLLVMGAMGYRKRTSFLTGVSVAQISEFSLVLAALGLRLGHVSESVVALITAVGIITFVVSTYLILHGDTIFRRTAKVWSIFERRSAKEDGFADKEFHKAIIMIGSHRTGQSIIANLPAKDILVIDFDPDVIGRLRDEKIDHLFGDLTDPEIFERAHFETARLVISTSPNLDDNLFLLERMNSLSHRPKVVVRAETEHDVKALYAAGADYVLLPHMTAGQYLGKTIAVDPEMGILASLKKKDMEMVRNRKMLV